MNENFCKKYSVFEIFYKRYIFFFVFNYLLKNVAKKNSQYNWAAVIPLNARESQSD